MLKKVYAVDAVALVPESGTFAMESVTRQFGFVAYGGSAQWLFFLSWSQIFEMVAKITIDQPYVVFALHVGTSSGMILPDSYIKADTDAVQAHGRLFVLNCIASGRVWVDIRATGVGVLISAPQKGWSASPYAGMVMMTEAGMVAIKVN